MHYNAELSYIRVGLRNRVNWPTLETNQKVRYGQTNHLKITQIPKQATEQTTFTKLKRIAALTLETLPMQRRNMSM